MLTDYSSRSAPQPWPDVEPTDPLASFFAGNLKDIGIAYEAVGGATATIGELMNRLGIKSMYGCAVERGEQPPVSGAIEETSRSMNALIERLRELRGLCETVATKL